MGAACIQACEGEVIDMDEDYCSICGAPLEEDGTEAEELATEAGLCLGCYEEQLEDE